MKKLSFLLSTLAVLTLFGGQALADYDPFACSVEITYNGQNFKGYDDGKTEDEALYEAKDEACDRACFTDACEHDCMLNATVKNHTCGLKNDRVAPRAGLTGASQPRQPAPPQPTSAAPNPPSAAPNPHAAYLASAKLKYACRVTLRYDGREYDGVDNGDYMEKAVHEAVEEACEAACLGRSGHKQCEHACLAQPEILRTECFDQNDQRIK